MHGVREKNIIGYGFDTWNIGLRILSNKDVCEPHLNCGSCVKGQEAR